ncbi:MAG TPA: Gfo/Idh/MocA family oxidoreductase [Trichocoleus sp.]
MTAASIGVAVVGTGFGQKVHIPGLQAHHRTQVVALYHRDQEKARAIAQAHAIPHACTRLEDLVALPEVQAVSISTPPFLHYDQAKIVLEAGKHLLLEKPTTLSVEEARTLAALAEQQGVVATMDFEFRFVPAWQRLAELLQEGYVGQLRFVKVDWLVPGRANPDRPWNWYARKDQGGGALGAFASHTFDYITWLFGPVSRLCARLYTAIPQRPDPETGDLKPVDADDTCNLMLELADGTPCQVAISSVTYGGRGHWVEVYGDRGTLVLGSDNLVDYVHDFKLYGSQAGSPLTELAIPERLAFPKTYSDGRIAPFIRVVDHWVEDIDRGHATAPSLQDGVYSQLLMDLAHQSNTTGTWIDIPR